MIRKKSDDVFEKIQQVLEDKTEHPSLQKIGTRITNTILSEDPDFSLIKSDPVLDQILSLASDLEISDLESNALFEELEKVLRSKRMT